MVYRNVCRYTYAYVSISISTHDQVFLLFALLLSVKTMTIPICDTAIKGFAKHSYNIMRLFLSQIYAQSSLSQV